ncbi:MAG: hypothetical protein RLZZ612_1547 [Pseudomonadota bacterium]|jgi:hypothetical protein
MQRHHVHHVSDSDSSHTSTFVEKNQCQMMRMAMRVLRLFLTLCLKDGTLVLQNDTIYDKDAPKNLIKNKKCP